MKSCTLQNKLCSNLSPEFVFETILVTASLVLLMVYRPGASILESGALFLMYSAFALGTAILFYDTEGWSFGVSLLGSTGSIAAGLVIGSLYVTPGAIWWAMVFFYFVGVIGSAKFVHHWFESVIPRLFGFFLEAFVVCVAYCLIT